MDTGWKVSLGGHAALLVAALIGWPFANDSQSAAPQVVNVTLVTTVEQPREGAQTPPRAPEPVAPQVDEEMAALSPPSAPRPPEPPALPRPDTSPRAEAPAPLEPDRPAPPPPPVDRVAPVPQPAQPKPLPEADRPQEAVRAVPEPAPAEKPAEEQDARAPREAAPRIVTEAVETSPRPEPRPPRAAARAPVPTDAETPAAEAREPEPQPENLAEAPSEPKPEPPKAEAREDAVNSALAEALAGDPGPAEPVPQSSGPPLTQGERDGLRVAVSRCWNLAALSTEAAQVSVVVGMEMSLDGVPSNLRMISYRGGNDAAAQQAFETARRAVLRCQPYALPAEKYDQWRSIEMTFNPDEMRRR